MKTVLPTIIALLFAFSMHAQIITIYNIKTNLPIANVNVFNNSNTEMLSTNSSGKVNISPLHDAKLIVLQKAGYTTVEITYKALTSQNNTVKLIPNNTSLDKVVVSAGRWPQFNKKVPGRVITISPYRIAINNPQTAADVLAQSGQVFVQKSQLGGGSPMMRGFATNRILLVVDGVRMNTAIFRSGNLQNVIVVDPLALKKVEVLFGPGSVLYGSDAIGGVINYRTLRQEFSLTDELIVTGNGLARFSSASTGITTHFDVNVGWKKWAFLTSASYSRFGDLRMGRHGPDEYLSTFYVKRIDSTDVKIENKNPLVQKPTGYSQLNLMQKVAYKPLENLKFEYAFHYSISSDVPRYDRLSRTSNGQPAVARWYYGPQKWMMNRLGIKHTTPNILYSKAKLNIAWQSFEESRHDRDFNSPALRHRTENIEVFSLNLDFQKAIGKKSTINYGLQGIWNLISSEAFLENIDTQTQQSIGTRYPDGSNWNSYAVYLQYIFQPNKKFALKAGVRYSYIMIKTKFDTTFYPLPFTRSTLNKSAPSGNLGFVYSPTKSWRFRLNLSTGFRAPNIDDIGKVFDSEPGEVIVPNPNLEPEYAYNADLGVAKTVGKWLKISATGYFTYLDNAMVRRNFQIDGKDSIVYDNVLSQVSAIQNAANAIIYGVQANVKVNLPAGFGIFGYFNWQDGFSRAENGDKTPIRHVAPMFGNGGVRFQYKRLRLKIYCNYSGSIPYANLAPSERDKPYLYASDSNGKPYSPAWYTLNFKVRYQINQTFGLSTGVENITDQRYRTYSSGIAASGINFILSADVAF